MKNLWVSLIILLVCSFVIVGCRTNTPTATIPSPATQQATTSAAVAPSTTTATASKPTASVPAASQTTAIAPASATTTTTASTKYGGTVRDIELSSGGVNVGFIFQVGGAPKTFAIQTLLSEMADGTLGPFLASSYDVVTDPANLSVTFHLLKGVKFSDGTDFNAQAVKWNFDMMTAAKIFTTVTPYWKSVDVLDDYTVKVSFTQYFNKSLASFAKTVTYLISPTAYQKNGADWIRDHAVGTGPFVQSNFQSEVSLTAARNPNYWEQGKPYVDKFQYLFVADEMTRLALLKSGGAEILNCGGNPRIALDLQNAGYNIASQYNTVYVLVPDSANSDSPWSNPKVRQAADYAIDKQSIVKTFGYGFWEANDQISTSNSQAYDKNLAARAYDVTKAKQLLADAGFPNGFKSTIIDQNTDNQDIVVAIQSYLSKVGIQCEIQPITLAKFTTYHNAPGLWKNAIFFDPYAVNPNPTQGMNAELGTHALSWASMLRPAGVQPVIDAAMVTPTLQPALVQKVEDIFYNDETVIPLYSVSQLYAVSPVLQDSGVGVYADPTEWRIADSWLKK
jgi:peptide/nickel transport system substrate-binding protein